MLARSFGRELCNTVSASAASGSTLRASEHVVDERARCGRASTLCASEHVVRERKARHQAKNQKGMPFPFKSLLQHSLGSDTPGPNPVPALLSKPRLSGGSAANHQDQEQVPIGQAKGLSSLESRVIILRVLGALMWSFQSAQICLNS